MEKDPLSSDMKLYNAVRLQKKGFEDKILGLPFPPEYETMTSVQQNNYEIGRLKAAEKLFEISS